MQFRFLSGDVNDTRPDVSLSIDLDTSGSYYGWTDWNTFAKSFQVSVISSAAVTVRMGTEVRARTKLSFYMRQLGFMVGLQSTTRKKSVMYPTNLGTTHWSRGDRKGLRLLGRPAGCMPPPSPITELTLNREGDLVNIVWQQQPSTEPVQMVEIQYQGVGIHTIQGFSDHVTVEVPSFIFGSSCGGTIRVTAYNKYGSASSEAVLAC